MNMPLVLLNRRRRGFTAFSPSTLFSSTAIGIWLDPSDVANLAWRRNLLTYSEQFDNAIWTKSNAAVSASVTDPVGGNSADTITATANSAHILQQISVAAGQSMVPSVWIRRRTGTGAINMWNAAGSTVNITSSVSSSWSRVTVPSVIAGSSPFFFLQIATSGDAVDLWGAQLELGTSATDYQRITDVNTEVLERFPTATMFSDRAGTTPVTTPGTVVGLRLDKSKGLVLGAELVTNGTFDGNSTTGWTGSNATLSSTSSALIVTPTTTNALAYTAVNLVVGKSYVIKADIVAVNGSTQTKRLQVGTSITGGQMLQYIVPSTPQSLQAIFVATATVGYVNVYTFDGTNATVWDNISVRELAGNHAVAPTDAARPIYGVEPKGGRRNLLLQTEAFDTASWVKARTTVTANAGVAPDGTTTADKLVETAVLNSHICYQDNFASSGNVSASVYAKSTGDNRFLGIRLQNALTSTDNYTALFDVDAGEFVTQDTTGASYTSPSTLVEPVGSSGWYRFSVSATSAAANTRFSIDLSNTATPSWSADGTVSYTGDGTSGILIWGAQLELGSTATAYQRVTTAYDVTESGVPSCHYVQYDGSDDSMSTAAIDFTATDKMSVFAGVRKLSDAATAVLLEHSASIDTNNGTFLLTAPSSNGADSHKFSSKGTVLVGAGAGTFAAAPISSVLSGLGDISGDVVTLRRNGTQVAQSTADQGTGNYGNYPLFFGRRNNTSNPFNGKDYGIIIVGKAASAGEITDTETWLAAKTSGVTL